MTKLTPSDRALLFPAWAAADGLGQVTLLSIPFMLGMFVENLGIGPGHAGLLLSVELCTISVICMGVSFVVNRLPKRTLAGAGAIIAIVGNALSLGAHDFRSLVVVRAITGIGYGLAMAAGNAIVATAQEPVRLYDKKMTLFATTQLLLVFLVPSVIHYWGPVGFFGLMIVMNLLMFPLVLRLPQCRLQEGAVSDRRQLNLHDRRGKLVTILLIAIVVIFAVRESAYWGFVEQFGAAVSVDAALVGLVLGIGTLPSVVAPRLATLSRDRFGVIGPTSASMALECVVLYLLSVTNSKTVFLILLLVWPAFYCYTVPLFMGVASRLDTQGRVIAMAAGALQIAFALGPAIAGAVVQRNGLHGLRPLALTSTAVLLLLAAFLPRLRERVSGDAARSESYG